MDKTAFWRRSLYALALTTSAIVLTGCVSSAGPSPKMTPVAADQAATDMQAAETGLAADGTTQDPQVVALGDEGQAPGDAASFGTMPAATTGQPATLALQTTGLQATTSSIYASQPVGAAGSQGLDGETPGQPSPLPILETQPGVKPATNSLFQSDPQPAAGETVLPLEGANAQTTGTPADATLADMTHTGTTQAIDPAAGQMPVPQSVPVPLSGVAALNGEVPSDLHPVQVAAADVTAGAQSPEGLAVSDADTQQDDSRPLLTFASLFAAKRKSKGDFDGDRFTGADRKRNTHTPPGRKQAGALAAYNALPGVRTTSMFATVDDTQPSHDDESGTIEVASLPGLARLAPNGLWLQTEKVETGCFRPELMQVLKIVENHYGRKVMVTSGLRDLKHNRVASGRRQSLHTTCEAADIQIPGIGKWELAEYLRTIPGRGGVGTYCHTESVHIDIGTARDWNWRCRRRKG